MKKNNVIPIRKYDEIISQIKTAYIEAPQGEFPTVEKIFTGLGLKKDGKPNLSEVKAIAKAEVWQCQREQRLEEQFAYSAKELSLHLKQRNIELLMHVMRLEKVTSRLDTQYLQTGKVLSLDGQKELDYRYDPRNISLLALTQNEILKVHNLADNFVASMTGSNIDRQLSIKPEQMQLINKIQNMTPEQLKQEIDKMDQTILMLTELPPPITIEEIKAQNF